jgi:hypothetical protein
MKTKLIILAMALVTIIGSPVSAKDDPFKSPDKKELKYVRTTDPELLTARLKEIELISKKDLTREEKKALREETKEIEKVLKEKTGGGVYISFGAILLIVLLLIILL